MKKLVPVLWLFLIGCQSWDRTPGLTLYNKTGQTIYYWASCDTTYSYIKIDKSNTLPAGDSVQPYLIYGPEGKGPDQNPWVNAINSGDDSALHVYCLYVDFVNDPNPYDSLFNLVIKRNDFRVDSLRKLNWKVNCY
jgi:endo-1,4-beta-mannosidase